MKLDIEPGTTSKRIGIFMLDSSKTDGSGLAALTFASGSLTWHYWREDHGNVAATSVTLATMTRGTWATGGFIEKDATNMPGLYELGVPDAVLAKGAKWAIMVLKGAANMAPVTIELQLSQEDIDGLTLVEAQRVILAGMAGKLSGALTTNVKVRDIPDTKNRINATVDLAGNRTAVTVDGS